MILDPLTSSGDKKTEWMTNAPSLRKLTEEYLRWELELQIPGPIHL